jgi:hypothetical protein
VQCDVVTRDSHSAIARQPLLLAYGEASCSVAHVARHTSHALQYAVERGAGVQQPVPGGAESILQNSADDFDRL